MDLRDLGKRGVEQRRTARCRRPPAPDCWGWTPRRTRPLPKNQRLVAEVARQPSRPRTAARSSSQTARTGSFSPFFSSGRSSSAATSATRPLMTNVAGNIMRISGQQIGKTRCRCRRRRSRTTGRAPEPDKQAHALADVCISCNRRNLHKHCRRPTQRRKHGAQNQLPECSILLFHIGNLVSDKKRFSDYEIRYSPFQNAL